MSLEQKSAELRNTEQSYRPLFENAPVPLWEEDLSEIKSRLDRLRDEGIKDLKNYLRTHPEELLLLVHSGKLLCANKATVDLFLTGCEREVYGTLEDILIRRNLIASAETLQSIWEGKSSFEVETLYSTSEGEQKQVILKWSLVPGYESDYGRVLASVGGIGLDITKRKEAEVRAVEPSEQLRAFASRLQTAREEERASIAREIHDELGQKMTRLKIGLSIVRDNLMKQGPQKRLSKDIDELERSLALVDGLMRDVRRIATELRPEELDELGLTDAMKRLVDQYTNQAGLKCRFHMGKRVIALDRIRSSALFRIFQEAMTNVITHAGATEVNIRLSKYRGKVKLEVADNGCGFDEIVYKEKKGLGILGMRERALSVGGLFSISKIKSGGTLVHVEINA